MTLINSISSAINRNETTLGILLDLSKAFDTITHEILCRYCFGVDQKLSQGSDSMSSLGSIDLICGKFYVASCRAQFLAIFCLLLTLMIFLMSLVSLDLYCLPMIQVPFVPIQMPTTSFLLVTMNLQK